MIGPTMRTALLTTAVVFISMKLLGPLGSLIVTSLFAAWLIRRQKAAAARKESK